MILIRLLGGDFYRYLFDRCVGGDDEACRELAEFHILVRILRGFLVPASPLPPLPGPQPDHDSSAVTGLYALLDVVMAGPQPEPPTIFGGAFSPAAQLQAARAVHQKLADAAGDLEDWIARLEKA
jgi:hypothetical protein